MKKNYISALLTILVFSFSVYSQNYRSIVKTYLDNNIQEYNLVEEDVNEWIITNEVYSEKSEVTHIYIQQAYKGIPINGAVGNFSIKDNEIRYAKNSFISNISTKANSISPIITPERAIEKGAAGLNLGVTSAISLIENTGDNKFIYSKSGVSQENIPVNLVYQPIQDGTLKLSWDLSIFQLDGKHWWSLRVDASSGEVLHKNDWGANCDFHTIDLEHNKQHSELKFSESVTRRESSLLLAGEQYNVYAIPTESPNHGPRIVLTEPQNTAGSPYGWHDTNEADGAEYTTTRGNNVYAQQDSDGSNATFGYAPDGGATLNFNFSLDTYRKYPTEYRDASLTNLFYINNIMHDVWFQYGFNVAAGNFQDNIYDGRFGSGNDYVIADGQDVSGRNNANFFTPSDGIRPRMQMYVFDHPNLLFVNSGTFQGDYAANDSGFDDGTADRNPRGVRLNTLSAPVTADLVIANDGSSAPIEACDPLVNGTEMNGKIAIIRRGNCDFTVKVQNAQDAGAIGVIMVNNVAGAFSMGGTTSNISIPAISIQQALGESFITAIQNGETINVNLADYGLDGSFDNGVIAHEYGHGISNRLIGGGNNVSCMQNAEQQGEGWSDFFGLMITIEAGDTGTDRRGIGTFDLGQSTTGNGFRQFPYSTDTTINPFTFDDVKDQWFINTSGNQQVSVHGVGSIWATMMWDLNWKMIDAYGLDLDIYNGTGGNNMTMHLAIEGLKIAPCSNSFIEMRDAIIAADDVLYNGDNLCLIWQVFSARGLGYSASSGDGNSYSDQTEAFDMPPADVLGDASCTLGVKNEKSDLFNIYPNPSNGQININGTGINEEVAITIFDINGREVYNKKTTLNGSTNINATNLNTGFYILKIKGKEFIYNKKILIE